MPPASGRRWIPRRSGRRSTRWLRELDECEVIERRLASPSRSSNAEEKIDRSFRVRILYATYS
jgi:hypothetical protein